MTSDTGLIGWRENESKPLAHELVGNALTSRQPDCGVSRSRSKPIPRLVFGRIVSTVVEFYEGHHVTSEAA